MKKYGVSKSWTRLMMIPNKEFQHSRRLPPFVDPLFILEDGIILLRTSSKYVLYNLNNGRVYYPLMFSQLGMDLHIYHGSLVSPQW